ncbi:MAG: hypothetical protein P4L99_13300 [Chthoniobacter sp.]|nr:hypothetical protein [Chthoniobacter sp.]
MSTHAIFIAKKKIHVAVGGRVGGRQQGFAGDLEFPIVFSEKQIVRHDRALDGNDQSIELGNGNGGLELDLPILFPTEVQGLAGQNTVIFGIGESDIH